MSKNKTITFIPASNVEPGVFDAPVPAKNVIPEWYKKQDKYTNGIKEYSQDSGAINHTIKNCMPVFDIMSAGYLFLLPADVHFSRDDNNISTLWSTNSLHVIQSHPQSQYNAYSIPSEYDPVGLKFINPWITKTPKGYSSLFIQPAYRDDLPFYTLPAVVDTDNHPININFPFFIRKDFEGIIPMGTPIMQVIPFKRDSWNHEVSDKHDMLLNRMWKRAEGKIANRYKTFFRARKEWN